MTRKNSMTDYKTIAETKNFIVLDQYAPEWKVAEGYQSEGDLEREFIRDLQNQGYEYLPGLTMPDALLANVRVQLQALAQSYCVPTGNFACRFARLVVNLHPPFLDFFCRQCSGFVKACSPQPFIDTHGGLHVAIYLLIHRQLCAQQ